MVEPGRRWLVVGLVAAALGAAGIGVAAAQRPPAAVATPSAPATTATTAPSTSASSSRAQPVPTASPSAKATFSPSKKVVRTEKAARAVVKAGRRAAARTTSTSSSKDRIRYGKIYRGHATFYAATGAGNCSYEPTGDLMVGAMNQVDYQNSQACGAYLAVTGPSGATMTIKVAVPEGLV